jgi:hypothetical protein
MLLFLITFIGTWFIRFSCAIVRENTFLFALFSENEGMTYFFFFFTIVFIFKFELAVSKCSNPNELQTQILLSEYQKMKVKHLCKIKAGFTRGNILFFKDV